MKEKFLKVFANLPIPLRSEIIYVSDKYGPMTWNVVKLEVDAETSLGLEALTFLTNIKVI